MPTEAAPPAVRTNARPWYKILYIQVLIAIALGVCVGHLYPDLGKELKPLGDGFIALIKMMIAPVIFCTVVHGISSMGDLKRVGRVGLKALIYFEVVSTVALAVGLLVGELLKPGAGFNIDPSTHRSEVGRDLRHQGQGRRHRRPSAGDHSRQLFRRARPRRPAAGAAGLDPVRLCHRPHGQGRRADLPRRRPGGKDVLRHHPHHRAGGADRRVRRHGLHGRRLWPRFAGEPAGADRHVLPDQHPVRAGRAGLDRALRRLLDPPLHRLYQG